MNIFVLKSHIALPAIRQRGRFKPPRQAGPATAKGCLDQRAADLAQCSMLQGWPRQSAESNGANPTRVPGEMLRIGGVKVFLPKKSTTILESNWEDLKYATSRRYGVVGDPQPTVLGAIATTRPGYNGAMHSPAGFAIIDLRDYVDPADNPLGRLYGLNLVGKQAGDVKLGLTITNRAAGDATIIYWDIVQPIPAALWEA